MAKINKARGEAVISLGGRDYVMAATYKAICAIESATGRGLLDLSRQAARYDIRTSDIVCIVYHAIDGEAFDLTLDAVGDFIVNDGIGSVLPAVVDFFAQALSGGAVPKKKSTMPATT